LPTCRSSSCGRCGVRWSTCSSGRVPHHEPAGATGRFAHGRVVSRRRAVALSTLTLRSGA
jgi:hypothetical protein